MQVSRRSILMLAAAGVLAGPALGFAQNAGDDKLILGTR